MFNSYTIFSSKLDRPYFHTFRSEVKLFIYLSVEFLCAKKTIFFKLLQMQIYREVIIDFF